jgi:hypothetical protein
MHLTSDNSQPPAWTFDSTGCPTPYHRWAANEDATIRAYGLKDRCISCRVTRYNPMSGVSAVWDNAVAAGPCPQKDWRTLDLDKDLRSYLIAWFADSERRDLSTYERKVLDSLAEVPA